MKEQFIRRLSEAKTEDQWNDICDEVKEYTKTLPDNERSGHYPVWWFHDVIMSGVMKLK